MWPTPLKSICRKKRASHPSLTVTSYLVAPPLAHRVLQLTTKMWNVLLVWGLVLRSSFPNTAPKTLFRFQSISASTIPDAVGIVVPTASSSLLIRDDDLFVDKFVHYNFTIRTCMWDARIDMERKVMVFRDLIEWLHTYNQSLCFHADDEDDWFAWQIATYSAA